MFFMYTSLALLLLALTVFLCSIPGQLDAAFHIQQLVYEFSASFYTYQYSLSGEDGSMTDSKEIEAEMRRHFMEINTNRFFIERRRTDTKLDATLRSIGESLVLHTDTGPPQRARVLETELKKLTDSVKEYSDYQKLSLTTGFFTTLFVLVCMVSLVFVLYQRNRNIIEKLRKAVEDREYLIREVHHRVKNNLTMVSSLIHLKSRSLGDEAVLSDIQHQISAISAVHESLYQQEDITKLEFTSYTEKLLRNLFFSMSPVPVRIDIDSEAYFFKTARMVPLGLIISELATNAVKYGFTDEEERVFRVKMRYFRETEMFRIEISNSGRLFQKEFSHTDGHSMGLDLIHIFVQQLQGSITLSKKPLTTFIIEIPDL